MVRGGSSFQPAGLLHAADAPALDLTHASVLTPPDLSGPEQKAVQLPEVQRLQTHPGVGAITALAFVLVLGTPDRFAGGKQVASYLGLIPCEESSAERWRLGHISKQGNALLRFLLGQAALTAARCDSQWRSQYAHLAMRRNPSIAKVAMARKLAVHLYWMWRQGWDYGQWQKFGSHAGVPGNRDGVQ